MTPNHILTEIARRLSSAGPGQIASIAKAVGINPALAADPLPSINESAPTLLPLLIGDEEVVRGAIPFELKLTVLGHEVTQTCRAVFSATLVDDVDRFTGESIRILGQVQINWQLLDWRDLERVDEETGEHPLAKEPLWTDDCEGLLPTAVPGLILDQIETEARTLEASHRQSTP